MSVSPMAEGEDSDQLSPRAFANSTLDLIAAFGCQPTPRAYEVFFGYASNDPDGIRNQIEVAAGPQKVLRSFDLERIYHDNFRSPHGEWERQEKSSADVESSLADVIAIIDEHMSQEMKYGYKLQKASSAMAQSGSAGDLRQIVNGLISETDAVLQAGSAASSALADQYAQIGTIRTDMESARHDVMTDAVTFLGNRQCFETELERALQDAVTNGRQLAFALIDIDQFRKINDEFDHSVGDAILRSIGQLLTRRLEGVGRAFRYGGEEFALVMPGSNARQAQEFAEKLRREIHKRKFVVRDTGAEIGQVKVSIGLTTLKGSDSSDDIVTRAMAVMSQIKAKGGHHAAIDGSLML